MVNLEEKLGYYKEVAMEVLKKDKDHSPMVFGILQSGKTLGFKITFKTDNDKRIQFYTAGRFLRSEGAVALISVITAWMSIASKDKAFDPNNLPVPSQDPNRKEVLIISAKSVDRSLMCIVPYKRKNEIIEFEKELLFDSKDYPGDITFQDNLLGDVFRDIN